VDGAAASPPGFSAALLEKHRLSAAEKNVAHFVHAKVQSLAS
jgi:hypothetical protein